MLRFFAFGSIALAVFSAFPALGQDKIAPPRQPNTSIVSNTFNGSVRVKANWDECYQGIGQNVPYDFVNWSDPTKPVCSGTKRPKIDAGYVWGSVVVGNFIYFGTVANSQCITEGGLVPDPSQLNPYETSAWACEFGVSPYSPSPLPAQIGDFRPPRIYRYDTVNRVAVDITPKAPPGVCITSSNPTCVEPIMNAVRGVRAATIVPGTNNDILMFAGPGFANPNQIAGGLTVYFLAYRISTGTWIAKGVAATGSAAPLTSLYDNIRRFSTYNGSLYTAVGLPNDGGGSAYGGAALRYIGNFNVIPPPPAPSSGSAIPVCSACFSWETVGYIDGEGAYTAFHENRMVIATWPKPGLAGIWVSPPLPTNGNLTSADAFNWKKVWDVSKYEPDPVIRKSWAMGAINSYNGQLIWGTQNVPWSAAGVIVQAYGAPTQQADAQTLIVKTMRPVIVGRMSNLSATSPTVDILYGDSKLPVFTPGTNGTYGTWTDQPTNYTPLFGAAGFGNPYNNYIWQMGQFNGKLYIGTMDWSYMAGVGFALFKGVPNVLDLVPGYNFGADLFVMSSSTGPAVLENNNGMGNYTNYGVRNILPVGTKLFIGTANPMNLLSNFTDNIPDGGWELIELTPKSGGVVR